MLALYHFGPVANSLTPLLCLVEKGLAFENRVLTAASGSITIRRFARSTPREWSPFWSTTGGW